MRVHLVQQGIEPLAVEANRARAAALLGAETIPPGSLVVLPELFSVGIVAEALDPARAEAMAADDRAWMAGWARETRSWMLGSTLSVRGEDKLSNLSVLFDPEGRPVLEYAKIHPFSLGGEDRYFLGGDGACVYPMEGFTLQPAICYDLRFPELFRDGMRRGADLITVQANWPESRQGHWEILLRARAIENQSFAAGVNCIGTQHGTRYAGGSRLISPKGEILAQAGEDECVVSADLSADHVKSWRRVFPVLKDRRPEGFWHGTDV
jgi:predicted amidohydrolase